MGEVQGEEGKIIEVQQQGPATANGAGLFVFACEDLS
jgi:hypothetical protein